MYHSQEYCHGLLLLLLSCVSCARLCVTPQTAAHQATLSLGFSRQDSWSGQLFPSPMHESESEVTQSCPTPVAPGLQPTRLLRPWDFPGKSTGVGCHCLWDTTIPQTSWNKCHPCCFLQHQMWSLKPQSTQSWMFQMPFIILRDGVVIHPS